MYRRLALVAAGVIAMFAASPPASASTPPLPKSMASLGDSITRATDACCWYGDHPGDSWSTGGTSYDGVYSHYERIRAVKPAMAGNAHNDAAAGARVSALATQATTAVSQGVDYVTILIGANDACTSSTATMTSTTDFASRFSAGLAALERGLPRAHVFVSSIPNVYRLWQVLHTNSVAQFVWSSAGICQSLLSSSDTDADRLLVLQRVQAFNQIMATACAAYANCRWDGGATFSYPFSAGQVSSLDYFHPNLSGQGALASVTWAASWWG